MNVSTFYEKLNKLSGNTYSVEEEITMTSQSYEAELQHDNINDDTVQVYTGPNLTGTPVGFTLSTPSEAPWKRIISFETTAAVVYITYETIGDQVESDDINNLQNAVVRTQNAVNSLEAEITGSTSGYTWNRLMGISAEDVLEITTQPQPQTVAAGQGATFTIVANGSSLTYQWQYVEPNASVWNNFTGGTSATLNVTPSASWNGRQVRCVVKNGSGITAVSNTVVLTVTG